MWGGDNREHGSLQPQTEGAESIHVPLAGWKPCECISCAWGFCAVPMPVSPQISVWESVLGVICTVWVGQVPQYQTERASPSPNAACQRHSVPMSPIYRDPACRWLCTDIRDLGHMWRQVCLDFWSHFSCLRLCVSTPDIHHNHCCFWQPGSSLSGWNESRTCAQPSAWLFPSITCQRE